jgi:quercetin dioxygenase-like cupin family protein
MDYTPMHKTVPTNQLWFQDSLVTIRVPAAEGQDGISILEHFVPHGFSPPFHLHRSEDEVFHVLDGEFRVRVQDQDHRLGAGDILLAPKGVPHTYRVESPQAGRCLTITARGDFERFVRAVSRPAEQPELPPPAGPPSADAIQALRATAAKYGIELVGPPLQ